MTTIINALIVSLIPISFIVFIDILVLGLLPSTVNRRHVHLTAFSIQTVTYAFADFVGLLAGAYILVKMGSARSLLILLGIITAFSYLYSNRKFSLTLFESTHRNKWQNVASVTGSILAGTLIYFIFF
jgi:hypothetical protein